MPTIVAVTDVCEGEIVQLSLSRKSWVVIGAFAGFTMAVGASAAPIKYTFKAEDDSARGATDIVGTLTLDSEMTLEGEIVFPSGYRSMWFSPSGWAEVFAMVNGLPKRSAFYVGSAFAPSTGPVFFGGATGSFDFYGLPGTFSTLSPSANFDLTRWESIGLTVGGCQEDISGCDPAGSVVAFTRITELRAIPEPTTLAMALLAIFIAGHFGPARKLRAAPGRFAGWDVSL